MADASARPTKEIMTKKTKAPPGLENMAELLKRVLAVPKSEMEARERAWQAGRKKKRRAEKTTAK